MTLVHAMSAQEFNEADAIRKENEKKYTDAIDTFAQKASDQRKAAWRKYQSATVKIASSFDVKVTKITEKIHTLQEHENNDEKIVKLEGQLKDLGSKKQEALTKANQKYGQDIEKIGKQCVEKAGKLKVPETMTRIDVGPNCNARRIGEIYQQFLRPPAR